MHTNCLAWSHNSLETGSHHFGLGIGDIDTQKKFYSLEKELALPQINLKAQLLTLTCSKPHSVNRMRLRILKKQIFKVLEVVTLPSSFLPPTSQTKLKHLVLRIPFGLSPICHLHSLCWGSQFITKNSLLCIHSRCLEYFCEYDKALALKSVYTSGEDRQ